MARGQVMMHQLKNAQGLVWSVYELFALEA
jgi:hypothetical protein